MDTLFLNEHAKLKNKTKLKKKTKNKFILKKTSVKTLLNNIFYKTNLTAFLIFCVDTLFLNEHTQLKKWFKLKKD